MTDIYEARFGDEPGFLFLENFDLSLLDDQLEFLARLDAFAGVEAVQKAE